MKKLLIINNIVDEKTFVKEVVNEMPITFGAHYKFVDLKDCIFVENGKEYDAKQWLKERHHIRTIIE